MLRRDLASPLLSYWPRACFSWRFPRLLASVATTVVDRAMLSYAGFAFGVLYSVFCIRCSVSGQHWNIAMNHVAAIKWTLANVKQRGPEVTVGELDQQLASESMTDADQRDCRAWLDGVLAQQGPQFRAVEALVLKLSTIGAAITERLSLAALESLSVDEIGQLMEAYLEFKKVIEIVVPKK